MALLGEQHTAVDECDLPVDLEGGTVASDITEPAEWNDAQGTGPQFWRRAKFTHPTRVAAELPASLPTAPAAESSARRGFPMRRGP